MDYERIAKPQEKKRKEEEEEIESDYDNCKDVDVVSVVPEPQCSTSSNAQQRLPIAPFSKPAPSKWDDAQKWIASPNSNRPRNPVTGVRKGGISRQSSTKVLLEVQTDQTLLEEPHTKRIDLHLDQPKKFVPFEAHSYANPVLMIENSVAQSAVNHSRHDSSVAIQSATTFIPPPSTARSVSMRDMGTEMTPIASQEPSRTGTPVRATTPMRSPTSSRPSTPGRTAPAPSPTNPLNDHLDLNNELSEKELQMKTRREIMVLGTQLGKMNITAWASKEEEDKDASTSLKNVAVEQRTKSVIATCSCMGGSRESQIYGQIVELFLFVFNFMLHSSGLNILKLRFKREEMKIQAWENHQKAKTEAEMRKIEFSSPYMNLNDDNIIMVRSLDDIMKKGDVSQSVEKVEVERMRGRAHDRLMNKMAAARHKAEEKRAEAEAKRNRQAAKTEQQAEYIRRTGRIPSSFSCWSWCF
ncbi:hypothetical protein Patl1_15748 [Pistacia atlantica]|uniref:Uncharacterized protein n=1 Tax=Pistacia atlantica TaxID=434234 RepID=A0ACC1BAU8_9ROSI|nr:hypothetical protein Patl1_15748 [Pistacia atlantica]